MEKKLKRSLKLDIGLLFCKFLKQYLSLQRQQIFLAWMTRLIGIKQTDVALRNSRNKVILQKVFPVL